MVKTQLNVDQILDWMRDNWVQYASTDVLGDRLRIYVNNFGQYKVEYKRQILYQGSQLSHALAAWESV